MMACHENAILDGRLFLLFEMSKIDPRVEGLSKMNPEIRNTLEFRGSKIIGQGTLEIREPLRLLKPSNPRESVSQ